MARPTFIRTPSDDDPEIPLTLPMSLLELGDRIGVAPFQLVDDLMNLGVHVAVDAPLSDQEIFEYFGRKHRATFRFSPKS